MRIMTVAFALGTALVLCNPGIFRVAAHYAERQDGSVNHGKACRQGARSKDDFPYWDYVPIVSTISLSPPRTTGSIMRRARSAGNTLWASGGNGCRCGWRTPGSWPCAWSRLAVPGAKPVMHRLSRLSGDHWQTAKRVLFAGHPGPDHSMTARQYARLRLRLDRELGLDPRLFRTHSLRRQKLTLTYRRTGNFRAVQLLLGNTRSKARSDTSASKSMTLWQ